MKKLGTIVAVMAALSWLGPAWASEVQRLSINEAAPKGATHKVVLTHADLTETVSNTAQTVTSVFSVAAKQGVECVAAVLRTPFTYSGSTALNSTTLTVGDGTDPDLFLASMELNSNGTEVFLKFGRTDEAALTQTSTNLPYVASPTGKAIAVPTSAAGTAFTISLVTETLTTLTTNIVTFTDTGGSSPATQSVTIVTGSTPTTNTYSVLTNAAVALTTTEYTLLTNQTFGVTAVLATDAVATSQLGKKVYTAADTVDFTFTPSGSVYGLSDLDAGEVWVYFKVWDGR